jgi:hypothetical protein
MFHKEVYIWGVEKVLMFSSPLETHELYKFIGKITKCARYRLEMGDKWVRNKRLEIIHGVWFRASGSSRFWSAQQWHVRARYKVVERKNEIWKFNLGLFDISQSYRRSNGLFVEFVGFWLWLRLGKVGRTSLMFGLLNIEKIEGFYTF